MSIYIASKAKHGPEWVDLRKRGYPITSTWIDESADGATLNWPDLWGRCIEEASNCLVLVVIRRQDEVLKGAWAEVGAALASGKFVFAYGIKGFSISAHPLVWNYGSEDLAWEAALNMTRRYGGGQ